jgi:tetratricopeptide (TPR) repeat protein
MMKSSLYTRYMYILISLLWLAGPFYSCVSGSKGVIAFDNARIHSLNIEARKYYQEAFAYSKKKKPEDAIRAYSRSIQIDPSAAAYNGRCVEYYRTGRYESAVADANRAIRMNPKYSLSYLNRGNAQYKLKEYDPALKSYLRAVQLEPGNPDCYYNLGQAYYRKGLLDDALRSYDKTVELDPRHYTAWYNRACICSMKKDLKGAIISLEKAVAGGFADPGRMKEEPALENVRGLPEFRLLLGRIEGGKK